jgi:outer membrane receptor protein involved in Fe transport
MKMTTMTRIEVPAVKHRAHPLAAACATALALPLIAVAETPLEEIIVTAQKRQESIQSVPISIKVLSSDTLETVNADSLDDIARQVPSLSMADLGRGNSNVQIRGLGSNVGSVGTVAIYNDGIISAGRVQSGGTFDEQDSALFDVERVEVLRGPQGTLYGEGSFGGVINIISKRPNAQKFEAAASATWFDIEDGGSGSNDVNAMINVPLIKDRLAARLVGFRSEHQGYLDGYDLLPVFLGEGPPTLVAEDVNEEEVTGGRLSLGYTGENFDATLILKRQESEVAVLSVESDFFDLIGSLVPGGTDGRTAYLAGEPLFGGADNTTDEGILELNLQTGRGTWTSVTGYGQIDAESSGGVTDTEAWSEELRFSTNDDGPLNFTVGAYYRTVDKTTDAKIEGVALPFRDEEIDQWSVFGQLYWDMSSALRATFGLRYSEQDYVLDDLFNEPVLGPLAHVESNFDDLSPKVALDWQVDDDTLLYASVARGYRAGGANIDASLGEDPTFTREFDADSIWNYELGAKTSFWDRKLTVNAAVFYIDWSDIQIDQPIIDNITGEPFVFIVKNGEDAHSYGVEADIYLTPGAGWEIVLGGSLVNAQYDNGEITSPFGLTPLDGEHLPSAPEYLFNASVEKTFALGAGGLEAMIRADYSVRGNSFGDVPNTPPGTDFYSGRADNINLRAGIGGDFWSVQAFVTNLEDSDASNFNHEEIGGLMFRSRLQPRTVGVNVRFNTR